MKNILLLMMGGSGTRLGADIPKQYLDVGGHPIFYYIVKKYAQMEDIHRICIVSHSDWIDFVQKAISDIPFCCPVQVAMGGDTRSASVRNGLLAVQHEAAPDDIVLIHDATHPYVDTDGVREIVAAVAETGGATLGACQYDTCYQMNENNMLQQVIPRQELVSGASPEAFRFGDISRIYFDSSPEELAAMTSAGAIALAHHIPMKVIPARCLNLKITYPEDLSLFKILIHSYFFIKDEERRATK